MLTNLLFTDGTTFSKGNSSKGNVTTILTISSSFYTTRSYHFSPPNTPVNALGLKGLTLRWCDTRKLRWSPILSWLSQFNDWMMTSSPFAHLWTLHKFTKWISKPTLAIASHFQISYSAIILAQSKFSLAKISRFDRSNLSSHHQTHLSIPYLATKQIQHKSTGLKVCQTCVSQF